MLFTSHGRTAHVDRIALAEVLRVREAQFDDISRDLGIDDPRPGLERHLFGGDSLDDGEARSAPAPVSAHLHFAAVGIEEAPAEVGLVGVLDDDEPVGAHGDVLPADGLHELVDLPDVPQGIFAVVDEDEVVSASLDLVEFNHGHSVAGIGSRV